MTAIYCSFKISFRFAVSVSPGPNKKQLEEVSLTLKNIILDCMEMLEKLLMGYDLLQYLLRCYPKGSPNKLTKG